MCSKRHLSLLAAVLFVVAFSEAQTSVFDFLDLPVSSHTASLGGRNVSITDPEPDLLYNNPALLANVPERMISLDFMSFVSATKLAGIQLCDLVRDRSAYAVSLRYADYGSFNQTSEDNTQNGVFTAKDIALGGTYNYLLSDSWSGGVTGRVIYSKYSYYTSVAIGVDLGLNYYDPAKRFSFGIAATNLGGQIKAFDNTHEHLPVNVTAGVSWKLEHAPVRFSLTLDNLNYWKPEHFHTTDETELGFGDILMRHFIFGVDFLLSEQLYVAAGYNHRRRAELSGQGSKGLEGLTIGTGLRLKKVMFGISFGKYQVSKSSLLFNFATSI